MPARGKRIPCTTRLSYDEYREVVKRAKARGWSISDYLAYCARREILGGRKHAGGGKSPHTALLLAEATDG